MPTTSPFLRNLLKVEPGRYLTLEEEQRVLAEDPYLEPRLEAMRDARDFEKTIVGSAVDLVLRKYEFEQRYETGRAKCMRDVGAVFRWSVYCMVIDDVTVLENKLLYWMRTVIQSFEFPGKNQSIQYAYTLLRKESARLLKPTTMQLLDPFLATAENILPSE
jgi:hypothetical protein